MEGGVGGSVYDAVYLPIAVRTADSPQRRDGYPLVYDRREQQWRGSLVGLTAVGSRTVPRIEPVTSVWSGLRRSTSNHGEARAEVRRGVSSFPLLRQYAASRLPPRRQNLTNDVPNQPESTPRRENHHSKGSNRY